MFSFVRHLPVDVRLTSKLFFIKTSNSSKKHQELVAQRMIRRMRRTGGQTLVIDFRRETVTHVTVEITTAAYVIHGGVTYVTLEN